MFTNKDYPYGNSRLKVITNDGKEFVGATFASIMKKDNDLYNPEDYYVILSHNNKLIPWKRIKGWDFYKF